MAESLLSQLCGIPFKPQYQYAYSLHCSLYTSNATCWENILSILGFRVNDAKCYARPYSASDSCRMGVGSILHREFALRKKDKYSAGRHCSSFERIYKLSLSLKCTATLVQFSCDRSLSLPVLYI